MEIVNSIKTVYLGKATDDESSVPKDPNAFGFYIENKTGNLVLAYREFLPNFSIVGENLVFTPTTENPVPTYSIDNRGYLIQEVNGMSQVIGKVVGDSAYQIAVKNGFEGDEAQWLESLKASIGVASKTNLGGIYVHIVERQNEAGETVVDMYQGDKPIEGV